MSGPDCGCGGVGCVVCHEAAIEGMASAILRFRRESDKAKDAIAAVRADVEQLHATIYATTKLGEKWVCRAKREGELVRSHNLAQATHSYYCSESNYFSGDCATTYKSWAEFVEENGDADFDMNLVFRWDWTGKAGGYVPGDDPNYRDGELAIFWMGQRKGLFRSTTVDVCQADEPAVREWLLPRLRHLLKLWAPLLLEEK